MDDAELKRRGATFTAQEISQQPAVWKETRDLLNRRAAALGEFLAPLLRNKDLRIILTGAGSSAYIGQCLQPELLQRLGRRVEAIATTDLVAGPDQCFQSDVPTLLVSFARSGSSPESLAAVELAQRHVKDCYQLVITCNPQGELYKRCALEPKCFVLLLPEATHDRSFAMTSSFTSMLYAGLAAFDSDLMSSERIERLSYSALAVLSGLSTRFKSLAARSFTRVVYLGSRCLTGLANEASLKLLELTDGEVASLSNSPLGFRHGPKTFVNSDTLVIVFISNDPLTRRYDLDLLRELRTDAQAGQVLAFCGKAEGDLDAGDCIAMPGMSDAPDRELSFPLVVCAQIFAFYRALALGKSPDNPSASGTVNRVVKGVTIHAA
jgi:tagatose-6-phosphate ketose/aldose isomerase